LFLSNSSSSGATGVSDQLAAVTVTFDEAMDPATINAGSVVLVDGGAVAGTVTYDAPTMMATFAPAGNLDFITEHTIVVTTAVTDLAGNPLAATFTSKFTTEADRIQKEQDAVA